MFSTKFLFALVSLGMAAAVSMVLLARNSYNLSRDDDVRRVLIKDRDQAWALLKSEARVRLDELLRVAGDQDVMRLLQRASSSGKRLNSDERARLTTALQKQNGNLESYAADLLVALDQNGQAVAQVWDDGPGRGRYSLAGFPAVQSALRGFMQDDVWAMSTDPANPSHIKVLRVATRPVISSGRYVGAVVHGQQLNRAFAQRLANRLGTQVVFFRGPVILATGLPQIEGFEPFSDQVVATPLAELLDDEAFLSRGRSEIIELPGNLLAVYALVMGEASLVEGSEVGYAIVRNVPTMASSTEFISRASLEEWTDMLGSGSGVLLIVMTILILVGGFLGFFFEHGRPIRVLRREVMRLAGRDVDRLNVYAVSRMYRKTAEAINQALDKAVTEAAGRTGATPAAIDEILGSTESSQGLSSALFTAPELAGGSVPPPPPAENQPPPPSPGPPIPAVGGGNGVKPPVPRPMSSPRVPPAAPPAGPPPAGPAGSSRMASAGGPGTAQVSPRPPVPGMSPPMPPPNMGSAQSSEPEPERGDRIGDGHPTFDDSGQAGGITAEALESVPAIEAESTNEDGPSPTDTDEKSSSEGGESIADLPDMFRARADGAADDGEDYDDDDDFDDDFDDDEGDDEKTTIAGVPEELLRASARDDSASEKDETAYFEQIFHKFVETKRECGEPTDNLKYAKFSDTLRRNSNALRERYGCKIVRFQVYVKDGKAALKATPVRN